MQTASRNGRDSASSLRDLSQVPQEGPNPHHLWRKCKPLSFVPSTVIWEKEALYSVLFGLQIFITPSYSLFWTKQQPVSNFSYNLLPLKKSGPRKAVYKPQSFFEILLSFPALLTCASDSTGSCIQKSCNRLQWNNKKHPVIKMGDSSLVKCCRPRNWAAHRLWSSHFPFCWSCCDIVIPVGLGSYCCLCRKLLLYIDTLERKWNGCVLQQNNLFHGIQGEWAVSWSDLLEVFRSQVVHCTVVKVAFGCLHHWVKVKFSLSLLVQTGIQCWLWVLSHIQIWAIMKDVSGERRATGVV